MNDKSTPFAASLADPWHQFIDETTADRPTLFAFGLQLTGNPFDGEDLVHDALLKAFASAVFQDGGIDNLRSYLFRIMANLWIDHQRRAHEALQAVLDDVEDQSPNAGEVNVAVREAAERLFGELSPRERTAVVLHEGFGFRHREVADLLSTTEGAIRTALSRGRARLAAQSGTASTSRVDRAVLDRFVTAFTAGDVPAIRALLVEDVQTCAFPAGVGRGADIAVEDGWIRGSLFHHDERSLRNGEPFPTELEVSTLSGEPVLIVTRGGSDGMLLEEVWRFETEDGLIARIQDYCFCPHVVAWFGDHLGRPTRSMGYRFGDD